MYYPYQFFDRLPTIPYNMIGNAWGIRREVYEGIGYICDYCIAALCDISFNVAALRDPSHWNIFDFVFEEGRELKKWTE